MSPADRLAEFGWTADRDVVYASVLGELDITELAVRYLQLAADRGFADLERVMADPGLADARAQSGFAAVRDRVVANARQATAEDGPEAPLGVDARAIIEAVRPGRGRPRKEAVPSTSSSSSNASSP